MKRQIIYFFTTLILLNNQSAFSESISQKLNNGEIVIEDNVKSSKSGSVKMSFIVDAPPEKVWDLLINYDRWTSFMPDLEKIIIKENKPNYAIVYVKAKAPLGIDISYTLRRLYNKKDYLITWTMLEGKAKEVEGSWQIFPINQNKTKLIYTNFVDLGFMVSPKIISMLTKSKLPNLANGLKNYLKK
jgi:coenzyme Q-binding protein COQ10